MVVGRNKTARPLLQRALDLAVLYLRLAALLVAEVEQEQVLRAAAPDEVMDCGVV